jgi:hypothetical protein
VLGDVEFVSLTVFFQSPSFSGWTRYTKVESDVIYIRLVQILVLIVTCNL